MAKLTASCMGLIIVFLVCGNVWSQEVAIYYDPAKGSAWIDPAQMAPAAEAALVAENIKCRIVNAQELVTYMEANAEGIVIMTTGIAPGEIFQNKGEQDLVHTWLYDGGVMLWTGDWPFYYWDVPANCPAAAGEVSVFGVTVTQSADGTLMEPTDLGKELMPSIEEHLSSRPISLATMESRDFEYESYADNGSLADPIAFQAPKMEGWFVNIHTWPVGALEQVGLEMAELLQNRFLVEKAVESMGKLATTWGSIRVTH
jgi:hypothetical protein